MSKVSSVGTTLKSGSTEIGGLTSINGVEVSQDTVDVTDLGNTTGYKEYLAGFKDAGEVSAEGFLDDEDDGQAAALASLNDGTVGDYTINFPNGGSWSFKGVISKFSTSADVDSAVTFSISIKVSGKPTFTFASGGSVTTGEATS